MKVFLCTKNLITIHFSVRYYKIMRDNEKN